MKNFDINKDLRYGDVIRRINVDNANIHIVGKEYEFLKYNGDGCLSTICKPSLGDGGYSINFELVKRRLNVVNKITCNYIEAVKALKDGVTDAIYDNSYAKFHYNDKDKRIYNETGNSPLVESVVSEWIYYITPTKEKLFIDEFIEAMKKLIAQYLNGEKTDCAFRNCELCKTLAKVKNFDVKSMNNWDINETFCNVCPWVVITGKICSEQSSDGFIPLDPYERSKELIDWIQQYRDME